MNNLLAALLSGSGATFDHTYSVAVETGVVSQQDVDWEILDSWQQNTSGLRFGYALSPNLEILGSFHYGSQNQNSDWVIHEYEEPEDAFGVYSMNVNETLIHLGPKFTWNMTSWLAPYATAQGLLIHNQLQFGEGYSIDEEDSATFAQSSALGVGLTGAVGLEVRLRPIAKKVQLFTYAEAGATSASALNFSLKDASSDGEAINIGDLGYGGGYYRIGLGTKF